MPGNAEQRQPAKRRPTKRKTPRPQESEFYVIQIERWDWSFSFGVNPVRKHLPEPYWDHRHLKIEGPLLRPKAAKAETATLTFLPQLDLDGSAVAQMPASVQPKAVGNVSLRAGALQALLTMPHDVLPALLTALAAGRLRYVTMEGGRLFGR